MSHSFGIFLLQLLLLALLFGCVIAPAERVSPTARGTEITESAPVGQAEPAVGQPQAQSQAQADSRAKERRETEGSSSTHTAPSSSELTSRAASMGKGAGLSPGGTAGSELPTREIPAETLRGLIRPSVPERFLFVSGSEYQPLTVYRDIDGNGLEDVFLLLMEVPEGGSVSPDIPVRFDSVPETAITDMSRLFSEPYAFYLALFLRTPEEFVSMYRIPLGRWFVFDSFRGIRVDSDRPMPFAVKISFQTHEGGESLLVVFSDYNSFSFFSLKDSISVCAETRDIDGDGLLDIVEWRKVFEEGTGYETFLTWFKWDGSKFSQRDSTNIVRNLNGFLDRLGKQLSGEEWSEFLLGELSQGESEELKGDFSREALFARFFPPLS